jgi:hypothetical protein
MVKPLYGRLEPIMRFLLPGGVCQWHIQPTYQLAPIFRFEVVNILFFLPLSTLAGSLQIVP